MKSFCLLVLGVFAVLPAHAQPVTITVDTSVRGAAVNPRMYGVFLEEINTAVDGGLYAEMVRNRGFEDAKAPEGFANRDGRWVNQGGYATPYPFEVDKALPYWTLRVEGGAVASMSLDQTEPLHAATPRSCRLDVTEMGKGHVAIANEGYWGISVKTGERYRLSLWARCASGFTGPITATLQSTSGAVLSDVPAIAAIDTRWRQYILTLTATATDPNARLVLSAGSKGTVWFDMVSLFPQRTFKDRPNGLRADIAAMIADLRPGFVRFPGGCVVEGATHETAYNWKQTIGPIEQRPEVWNVWDYRRTHGMGFFEYLQFCEDVGAAPMFVASAGQTCIYRRNTAPIAMANLQPLIDNFLGAVEYANGPVDSPWGQLRAAAGHPEPFGLTMLEIGNENVGREYEDRYAAIYPAIKAKYPDLLTLACFNQAHATTEMVDEHFYSSPGWFIKNTRMYDRRDRNAPPVYLAEVAVTTDEAGRDRGNLIAALAEGVFLMGAERNADVVRMVSYAPLLANVHGRTPLAGAPPPWHGMIYFDNARCFGTVSYYLWKLFAHHLPTHNVRVTVSKDGPLHVIAGRDDRSGDVILKVINTAPDAVDGTVALVDPSFSPRVATMTLLTSRSADDNNSIDHPTRVVPATGQLRVDRPAFTYTFPSLSLTIIRLPEPPASIGTTAASGPPMTDIMTMDPPQDDFYAKRLDYHGIAIKSSTAVVDEALCEARHRLDTMLRNVPSVRANLAAAGAELHIIGRHEVPSDLPELRQYRDKPWDGDQTIDQRTRGVGGLHSSCGEENLLRLPDDRYRGRDICVHEFAHCIQFYGMSDEARQMIEAQHQQSLAAGLWRGAYAGTNVHEFFAELTMWYFGTHGDLGMADPKPANGPEGLKAYDPQAYDLLDRFYTGRLEVPVVLEK